MHHPLYQQCQYFFLSLILPTTQICINFLKFSSFFWIAPQPSTFEVSRCIHKLKLSFTAFQRTIYHRNPSHIGQATLYTLTFSQGVVLGGTRKDLAEKWPTRPKCRALYQVLRNAAWIPTIPKRSSQLGLSNAPSTLSTMSIFFP